MFTVRYLEAAIKDLRKIDPQARKRILLAIENLADNPLGKSNVKRLVNSPYFRLRVGDYRVIFDLQRAKLVILVVHIKTRGDVYKSL